MRAFVVRVCGWCLGACRHVVIYDYRSQKRESSRPRQLEKIRVRYAFCYALTRGARRFAPAIFAGSVYTPDEISGGGDYIEAEVLHETVEQAHTPAPDDIENAAADHVAKLEAREDAEADLTIETE